MAERLAASARIREKAPDGTAYLRAGAGEAIVFVHGVGMNAAIWQPQIDRLKSRYDVIAIDMLGHGASPLPPEQASLSDYARQVIHLLDHLGLDRASVVGHSMGALVVQEVALAAPERIRRLVSINAVFRRSPALAEAVRARAADLSGHGDPAGITATVARWFGERISPELADAAAMARAALESADQQGYARAYRLFARADNEHAERLPKLAMPALFMTGSEDRNSSPSMSAAMARLAPQGSCLVLDGEKHMMALASPEKVTRHILAFLESGDGAKATEGSKMDAAFDAMEFRRALGSFLTGVTIVTTIGPDGEPRGFTANSFTSVSLDPPLVLICIAKKAHSHPVFSASKGFAVNILSEEQKAASGIFASKAADKFDAVEWHAGSTASPMIDNSVAAFDCDMEQLIDAGDHSILIGRVRDFSHNGAQPLGFCRGAYVNLGLSQEALLSAPQNMEVGVILEDEGRVLFFERPDGNCELPAGAGLGTAENAKSLMGKLSARAIQAQLGFLFAVWDDAGQSSRSHVYYLGTLDAPCSSDGQARLVEIDRIANLKIADPAVCSMLARYVRERTEDAFGIYVGNEREGEVRPLAKSPLAKAPLANPTSHSSKAG
ncbi:alpha/beta fold hydrolase [Mesorhizobium sp. A623]